MNKDQERYKLLDWVKEYEIEDQIREVTHRDGYEAAIRFTEQWFDGWGEAEWIVAYFLEN